MTKSCINCPAFMGESDAARQRAVYGTNLGMPTCARTGRMLGAQRMSAADTATLQTETASSCAQYGKPVTSSTKTYVTLSLGLSPNGQDEPTKPEKGVASCKACHFYVDARRVGSAIGVPIGLCSKFGKLVPDTKTHDVARVCTEGVRTEVKPGEQITDHYNKLLKSFVVAPILAARLPLSSIVGGAMPYRPPAIIEPSTYPTDKPVTDAQAARGIRAWRKLEDKNSGNHVFMPMFRRDFFPPEEQKLIPVTGGDEHVETYVDHQNLLYKILVLWRHLDETPAVHGVPGTGKTELFRYAAWWMGLPFHRISITRSSDIDELAGMVGFHNNETVFEYGIVPKFWKRPCVAVFDEPNVGPPEVWQFIRPLTDNSKQLVLPMNNGEIVQRNDDCYFGMAMNPSWDSRNIGAEPLAQADGSRLMHISVGFPNEDVEKEIIRRRCFLDGYDIDGDTLSSLMSVAKTLREMDDTLTTTWGLREQIKTARATRWFGLLDAYRLAVTDMMDPTESTIVLDAVKANAVGDVS